MKWITDQQNPPGPVQFNKFSKALRSLQSEHNHFIELRGVIGHETPYDRAAIWSPFGAATRDDVMAEQRRIGTLHGWTISRDNAKQITEQIEAALVELAKTRPVHDHRKTPEQVAERDAAIAAKSHPYCGNLGNLGTLRHSVEPTPATPAPAALESVRSVMALPLPVGALGTVAFNQAHDGVEIKLNEKPSNDLRARLQRAGFRITRRPPWKWYNKFSAANWTAACVIVGVTTPCPSVEQPDRFDMEAEDRMSDACGLGGGQ